MVKMELVGSRNQRTVAIGSRDGPVEDVVKCKKISIADNKLGREAVMINAPTDLGHKEYKYVPPLTSKPHLLRQAFKGGKRLNIQKILQLRLCHSETGLFRSHICWADSLASEGDLKCSKSSMSAP